MKKYLLLIIALAIGAFLRLYLLSEVPNGLTWDEAGIGYNAYSILKTGRDEHGAFMPIIFKSFGDYKPGAYIYLTVPSIAIFGLNEFAVRFPSALAGILAILGVYLLTREILSSNDTPKVTKNPSKKAKVIVGEARQSIKFLKFEFFPWDFSALVFAILPWSVHFGHGAWEVNVFTTLTIFALYFFLRFIKNRSTLYPSLLFACLSLAMYQAAKLFTPLVFLLFVVIYWKEFWQQFLTYLNPKKMLLIFGSAGNRLNTLSIFNYKPDLAKQAAPFDGANSIATPIFHNQVRLSSYLVISRYLYHLSPEVLFYEGSLFSERGHIPSLGVLNPLEFIWLLIGLIYLSRRIVSTNHITLDKASLIIIGLFLISPIPGSLTLAEFSTFRSLFMVVPLAIISGLGIFYSLEKLKLLAIPIMIAYFFLPLYIYDIYFFHSQTAFATEYNYGYKQAVQIIKDNPAQKVIFTDVLGQPYIYYVFYTAYDPATYQRNVDFIDGGLDVGRVGHVGNVEFHQFGNSEMAEFKDTLFVGSEGNINNQFDITGPNVDLFRQIETPDHRIIFRVIKTKK